MNLTDEQWNSINSREDAIMVIDSIKQQTRERLERIKQSKAAQNGLLMIECWLILHELNEITLPEKLYQEALIRRVANI